MESDLRTIGEMARSSGLSVSALRFYDGAGVLVPARVDPHNGYRRYAESQVAAARLVAGLRRVGMPLTEISAVLSRLDDSAAVHTLIDAHLGRLEAGLVDARREIARVHALVDAGFVPVSCRVTVTASALRGALAAVRYAAGADPSLPALSGVFFEVVDGVLRLVTTDRFRMAVADLPVGPGGAGPGVIAPLPLVDALVPLLVGDGPVGLSLAADAISVRAGGHELAGAPVPGEFPDYRRALAARSAGGRPRRITVDVDALRASAAASSEPVVVLADLMSGAPDQALEVAVNREFLLQALDAGGPGQLVLELDGPIMPLALRGPDSFSVIMPVRL